MLHPHVLIRVLNPEALCTVSGGGEAVKVTEEAEEGCSMTAPEATSALQPPLTRVTQWTMVMASGHSALLHPPECGLLYDYEPQADPSSYSFSS